MDINMFSMNNILFGLLLPLCSCVFVEISLNHNKSLGLRLICGPELENFHPKTENHTILWNGYKFGDHQQQKLAERLQCEVLVPNLSIKSSKTHRCYLLAPRNSLAHLSESNANLKKRVARNSKASIPAKKGVCPPGYRIDQDRCFPCFPGSYTSGQSTECFLCPKDFYVDKQAADSCWPCPDGKKTLGQGTNSEESCFYLDGSGHPVSNESNTTWIIMISLIAVLIVCLWIVIILFLIRYCRKRKVDDAEKIEKVGETSKHPTDEHHSESREHIYERIDSDDTYEEPREDIEPPVYVDLDAPEVPPKRFSRGRSMYEIPISRSSRHPSQSLSRKSSQAQAEAPIHESSERQYEVPLKRNRNESMYETSVKKIASEPLYEVPVNRRWTKHSYETPKAIGSDDNLSGVIDKVSGLLQDASGHVYEVIKELADDLPYVTNGERSKSHENERRVSKTLSTGFDHPTTTLRGVKSVPSVRKSSGGSSGTREFRNRSSEDWRVERKRSGDRMDSISEDHMYDYQPSDEEQ